MNRKTLDTISSKKVFLIGDALTHEGITAKITSLGHSYVVRNPFSYPSNWLKIVRDLDQFNNSDELLGVFLLLTERTLLRCCSSDYQEVFHELLLEMKQTASLIFVYEDNLLGKFSIIEKLSK